MEEPTGAIQQVTDSLQHSTDTLQLTAETIQQTADKIHQSAYQISIWSKQLLESWGIAENSVNFINLILQLSIVILFVWVFQWATQKLITFILTQTNKVQKLKLSGFLIESKFPRYLALTAPLSWIRNSIPIVFEYYPSIITFISKVTDLFIVWMLYWLVNSILKAFAKQLTTSSKYKDKPIDSYFQVIRILLMILTIGATFTILSGQELSTFFTAMGAASAIMMLIFKDTILGFVASIQVTTNDMVRLGDWITMPKYNADGDVMQITLTTVKVINFDKTISTIPTYALISDSFQNWRGMAQAGGRRIKRSITFKQSSFKFIEKTDLEFYKQIQSISSYIEERQKIIDEHNASLGADTSIIINGRNLTNIGLFRKYTEMYLRNHPDIHKGLNIMVRQLAPTEKGLPLEIYCFTNTTIWAEYENIMADIFDHLTSATQYFELEIFEDISNLPNSLQVKSTDVVKTQGETGQAREQKTYAGSGNHAYGLDLI